MQTHETVLSFRKIGLGSNRKFGVAFGAFFAVLGLWPSVALLVPDLLTPLNVPDLLTPLNRAWFKLGIRGRDAGRLRQAMI